jgi:hypothetical protein
MLGALLRAMRLSSRRRYRAQGKSQGQIITFPNATKGNQWRTLDKYELILFLLKKGEG